MKIWPQGVQLTHEELLILCFLLFFFSAKAVLHIRRSWKKIALCPIRCLTLCRLGFVSLGRRLAGWRGRTSLDAELLSF